jgi:hypothetical protein
MKNNVLSFYLLAMLCFFPALVLNAQDTETSGAVESGTSSMRPVSKFRHELGVAAGFTTGFGPAYRILHKQFGAQVCFTPINDGRMEMYSTGLTFFVTLTETENTKFFLYQGNHYFSQVRYNEGYSHSNYNGSANFFQAPSTDKDMYWNNGFGFGIELFHKEQSTSPFGFLAMCGLASMRSFTRANFTAEAGLFYKFPFRK